jgi:regulator of RNase E activity RraA
MSMVAHATQEISARLERLYVPAVADVLDCLGRWNQLLSIEIAPLQLGQKIAGPAFTAKGHATADLDTGLGASVLDGLTSGCVAVWDTSNDRTTGHWGELMSTMAQARGCRGAIIDGGIRDSQYILRQSFPVWSKFRCAADAMGRWKITDANVPVVVSGVVIRPGDFIFADIDGVLVIPAELVEDVVARAEAVVDAEDDIREAVSSGEPLADMYEKFKLLERSPRV